MTDTGRGDRATPGLAGRPIATAPGAATLDPLAAIRDRVESMAHLGIWRTDAESGRATWSAELFRILSLDPAGAVPVTADAVEAAIHPADRDDYGDAIAAASLGERGTADCRLVRPDGTVTWIRVAAEAELDAAGDVVALIGYVQEVPAPTASPLPPQVPASEAPGPAPAPRFAPKPVKAGVVLLVEDDDAVRVPLGRMLGSLGFSVLEASSADEALELIGHDQDGIDLVVTDIRLPGIQGPELVRRMREVREVPVVFVSGYAEDLAADLRAASRTRVVDKPFDAETLGTAVRSVLADGG